MIAEPLQSLGKKGKTLKIARNSWNKKKPFKKARKSKRARKRRLGSCAEIANNQVRNNQVWELQIIKIFWSLFVFALSFVREKQRGGKTQGRGKHTINPLPKKGFGPPHL